MARQTILLASHNTSGAQCAEQYALQCCTREIGLTHLRILPDFWQGMMGDDWLNNAATQKIYANYLEETLSQEIQLHFAQVSSLCAKQNITYESFVVQGDITYCLAQAIDEGSYQQVVIGSPRPPKQPGFNDKMNVPKLLSLTAHPITFVPFSL